MHILNQSPTDPAFVQDPYTFYEKARRDTPVAYWEDYGMLAAFDHATVHALLRDKRLGREVPAELRKPVPDHLQAFDAVEQHSMLEKEGDTHRRLRGLVLRAFTSRRIANLNDDVVEICNDLIAQFPKGEFDLIPAYCTQLPVRVIARLLGVPEEHGDDLLRWSNAMVSMYQANRSRAIEDAANAAASEFSAFLRDYIETRRDDPRDDLITNLIAAEEDGVKLSTDELIGTCVLLLNAGHEATVHSMGNAIKTLLEHNTPRNALAADNIADTAEELLRYDPPLHMFTRYAYEDIEIGGLSLQKGDEVALVLGSAGRCEAVWDNSDQFAPGKNSKSHLAFGGGLHFCVGAPLARLEMQIGLKMLFDACPNLKLAQAPVYADSYHFHKLEQLMVSR
ncbi:MAG: cytochrome P450 [Ascidiaceihabitans sp.]|nr:cytochrome P450 [Ascidiaceihabitans sp.]